MLAKWMHTLSKELELDPPIREEAPRLYLLPFDEERSISIEETDQGYRFSCPLVQSASLSEELLIELMHATLFGQGTYGAILSLDSKGKTIEAHIHDPYSSTYGEFREKLEDFINNLDFWQEQLKSK